VSSVKQSVKEGSPLVNLYKAKPDCIYTAHSLPDVKLLENMGIRLGTKLLVRNRYAFGGPVVLRVEDAYTVAVGKDIAKQIIVAQASGDGGVVL